MTKSNVNNISDLPRPPVIPPSVSPLLIDRHYLKDLRTRATIPDAALDAIRDAMSFTHETVGRMSDAHRAIMGNEMETLPRRQKQSADAAYKLFNQATQRIDAANAKIKRELDEIEKKTSQPKAAENVPQTMIAAEIRAALSGMTHDNRQAALAKAVENGEDEIISAVLSGPSLLTGMSSAEKEVLRHNWRSRKFPAELDRVARIGKAKADLDRGVDALWGFWRRLSPDTTAAEASERAALEATKGLA